jgi:hypothetical protein
VKPGVRYVGDAGCVNCHKTICDKYHAHPMGRSAEMTARATPIEKYDAKANNPFRVGPFTLRVEKTPDGVLHHVSAKDGAGNPLPEYVQAADVAIGSGVRGRSYLAIRDGAVWQTPISWYSSNDRWDLSPGFNLGNGGRRAILRECLFCHVDRVEPVPGAVNRYHEPLFPAQVAIGCERCHGPGELHVSDRLAGGAAPRPDTAIVNPRHLPPALQSAVCEQCHLQGQERVTRRGRDTFEFRPGLPFEQFVTVFVRPPELADFRRSVGQFEQMEASRCFAGSGGRMVCTSCHDPHTTPAAADRDAFYRGKCLTCHESKGCSLPAPARREKNDSCTACHMPRGDSSNIAHASVTDHRVLRRPVEAAAPRALPPGAAPLVAFRSSPYSPPEAERERALGVALAHVAGKLPPGSPTRSLVDEMARDRLDASLKKWRGDAEAWAALSAARAGGDAGERLDAAEKAARLAPESEVALTQLAEAALAAGRADRTAEVATRLVAMNPSSVEPLLLRARAFAEQNDWEKAESDCRAALRIHPLHQGARLLLGICRHHRGDPAGGRREAETAATLATSPQQAAALRDWYRRATR